MLEKQFDYIASARRTIAIELRGIQELQQNIDISFNKACDKLLQCQGRIIVTGMGKSGHIARKIAATLSSTGSPAFFVHPAEASHGDLGMITTKDVVIAISNSGTSDEILTLIPVIKRIGCDLIAMTGNPNSTMATLSDLHLNIAVGEEACPLGLAPTSSTTATLVMGDAIAVSLLEARGFTSEEFALSHPSGALGKRLLLKVGAVMHEGDNLPKVHYRASFKEAIVEMTSKGLGMTTVVDDDGLLVGLFTDGDLRRVVSFEKIEEQVIEDMMSKNPKTIRANLLAAEAICIMEEHQILILIVVDEKNNIEGVLHMHDLLKTGIV